MEIRDPPRQTAVTDHHVIRSSSSFSYIGARSTEILVSPSASDDTADVGDELDLDGRTHRVTDFSLSPTLGSVMEDLMTYGEGLEVAERDLLVPEVGKAPQSLPDQVIAVVRDGQVHRYFDPAVTQLVRGDRLIVVRPAQELPWAPRPGTHGEDASDEEE